MHIELQQAMQHLVAEQSLNLKEVSRFTPVDFRLGIQWLVSQDQTDLAQALAEAGLALYPLSEDILAISGLLAITRETLIQERNAMAAVQGAMPVSTLTN